MPGGFIMPSGLCNPQDVCPVTTNPSSAGTDVPTDNGTTGMGPWTQLTAATKFDADAILLHITFRGPDGESMLWDLGVGSSGSEKVIIQSLFATFGNPDNNLAKNFVLPLQIPSGTRLAARAACGYAFSTNVVNTQITTYSASWTSGEGVAGYDAITDLSNMSSIPTILTPTTSAVKTAWTQVNASTSRDYCGLLLCVDNQRAYDSTNNPNMVFDVATGASGSESVIVSNISVKQSTTAEPNGFTFIPLDIKAGSRVSVRAMLSVVTAAYKVGIALWGAYH